MWFTIGPHVNTFQRTRPNINAAHNLAPQRGKHFMFSLCTSNSTKERRGRDDWRCSCFRCTFSASFHFDPLRLCTAVAAAAAAAFILEFEVDYLNVIRLNVNKTQPVLSVVYVQLVTLAINCQIILHKVNSRAALLWGAISGLQRMLRLFHFLRPIFALNLIPTVRPFRATRRLADDFS